MAGRAFFDDREVTAEKVSGVGGEMKFWLRLGCFVEARAAGEKDNGS